MTAPAITLTDHLNATSGDVGIEVGHAAHFECVSASTIGEGDWYQAKIEWSVDDSGTDYATGMRGFNFSHYFATVGSFIVTCRVTNVNGEIDTETRTVVVAASTRSTVVVNDGDNLKTVHDANIGADKEFVISGTVVVNGAIAPGDNNVFRSATPGTRVNVDWTGASASFFNLSAVDSVTWKDLHFRQGGATRASSVIEFDGTNNNIIGCTVDAGVCSGQMLNGATDPRGWLIQDCDTIHDNAGQNIRVGNTIDSRMLAVYGGSHLANIDNSERAMRGSGLYVSTSDARLQMDNITNAKDVLSISGGSYWYNYRSQFINSTPSGTGTLLLTGHTSGDVIVTDIVFDRCYMGFSSRVGQWRIGIAGLGGCSRLMVRNCVLRNVMLTPENVTGARFHHNTFYNPSGGLIWLNFNPTAFTATDFVITGNLSVWSASITEAILISSVTDTADEFTLVSNNVTGTPSQEDVDINDTVNGNKNENWATFNARANADGNLRKTVTVNASTFRPTDTSDSDLIITPHADMAPFDEDYHGNRRRQTWVIGAVDRAPNYLVISAGGFLVLTF